MNERFDVENVYHRQFRQIKIMKKKTNIRKRKIN